MGAAAISANAGSMLMDTESGLPYLHIVRPFVDGVTPIVWAWATLWIPLLALLGIWKHVVRRVPLVYTLMEFRVPTRYVFRGNTTVRVGESLSVIAPNLKRDVMDCGCRVGYDLCRLRLHHLAKPSRI
jgi:hypothetical protein